jgi:demethylmenaquinone methyltransferase/2-methoxy-6-polyprenyl-1,4-benzoquinol methylase
MTKLDKKKQVKNVFDPIAESYDFLNHLLSFGIDCYWRRKAVKLTGFKSNAKLLDVACGTGDFARVAKKKADVKNIIGLDYSKEMMLQFVRKTTWARGRLVQAVAEDIPFPDETFTNITVGFGVRNFYDIPKGLSEFYRVLENGGKATVLEFRLPRNVFFRMIYRAYFHGILPLIGRIVSKNDEAYKYLPRSVDEFESKVDTVKILRDVGFENIAVYSFTFGIVQCIIAEKK